MTLDRRKFLLRSGAGVAAALTAGAAWKSAEGSAPPNPLQPTSDDWGAVRDQFTLTRDYIHLAGLLLASHPAPVREAIERHRRGLDENPVDYLHANERKLEAAVRRAAAAYLGAQPEEIALTDSTTMGLGTLYNGLILRPGQEIVTSTHDHYATHESLALKSQKSGATLRRIPLYQRPAAASEAEIVGNLMRAVTPRTRIVAVTWVHSSTGVKLPIPAMANALAEVNSGRADKDRVLLCVDGVHGFGVENASMQELGCDFFVAGTHKWLFGPRGTGILWGKRSAWGAVSPTIPSFSRGVGWGGTMSPGGFHSFEHRWALGEAFQFHLATGKARIATRIHALNRQCKEGLAAMQHVTLYTPMSDSLSAGLVCFDVRGRRPREVVESLRQRGIIASTTPYATSYARVTPGLLNSAEEIDTALGAIRALG
ncbi:MAG: aminotransferase class V-fold PLP-dependent enzyme [Gemmatimonadetes bacterium]|nr:aminotransferase class V-fold PLP-dependent enzyme [Gemmatimonadota bacterium]MBA3969472.1 aminotransferase class V-fold PLP-dependent enzyme [Gemmatimonadota bacterium]